MPNNFYFILIFIFIFFGCSKKDLNLPQPSPMPAREAPPPAAPICSIEFTEQSSFTEVAIIAHEMQERCGYNTNEILKLARDFAVNYGQGTSTTLDVVLEVEFAN